MTGPSASTAGHVMVVGAINLDLVVEASRLPRPGETVVGPEVQRHGGGKGANAAVAAARAGARVSFIGALGTDATADEAERDLQACGVNCDGVARLPAHPTGVALIVVDPEAENQIAVGAGANHALSAVHVRGRISRSAGANDCVLVSSEILGEVMAAAVRTAAAAGVRCVLNPAPPVPEVLGVLDQAPILTPNRGELAALLQALGEQSGGPVTDGTAEDQARALGLITGAPICVTLGADGVLVCEAGEVTRVPGVQVTARDTTGAGDTFNGVLAAWLAGGASLTGAARAAATAASLSVTAVGARTGMPDREAIVEALTRADASVGQNHTL